MALLTRSGWKGIGPGVPSRRALARACRLLGAWIALAIAGALPGARAEIAPLKEYQIKALFLFNFAQFVEWPASAFPGEETPLCIGVLGVDPFGDALDALVQGERIQQRPIVIRRSTQLLELRDCHVIFICASERARVPAIIAATAGWPVLTVGDPADFARRGGTIAFVFEGQRIRFEINRAAAQRNGLKLSSQLLSLARLVGPPVEEGR